jgi:hypothetical protein
MRRYSGIKGIVALEEDSEVNVPEENSTAPESLDAAKAEMELNDSAVEGEQEISAVEDGEEVKEALESISDALKISAANGGLDKHAAAVVGIATQYMYNRVGYKAKAMPALESFGGTASRVSATQLAMEGIKDSIRKIWQAIVKGYKRIIAWAAKHWNKVFGAAERMQRRAKAIAKAADELGGKKQKQSSFEDESLVKALYVGSSMPSDMKGALSKLKEVTGNIISKADATIVSSDSLVEALGDTSGNKLDNIKVPALAINYKVSVEADKVYGASEGMVWRLSDELPGGVVYAERGPNDEVSGLEALALFGKVKRGIRPAPNTKVPSTTKVTTLNAGQIEAVAKVVEEIGSDVQAFRNKTAKLDELMNKAVKAAEKAGATADKEATTDEEKAERGNAKALQSAAGNIGNYLMGGFSTVTSNAIRTGQAALNYCDKSINQYE